MNPVDPISGAALHAQGVRDVLVYQRDQDGELRRPPTTYPASSLSQALEGEQGFVVLSANNTRWEGVVEFIRPDAGRRAAPSTKVSALDDWSSLLSEAATPAATPPAQPLTPNIQQIPTGRSPASHIIVNISPPLRGFGQKMRDGKPVCHRTACQSANNVINAHIHTGHLYCTSCALALNLWSQRDHGCDIVKIPPEGQWLTTIPEDVEVRFDASKMPAIDPVQFKALYEGTFEPAPLPSDMVERINQAMEAQEQGHPFSRSAPAPAIEDDQSAWSLDNKDTFPDFPVENDTMSFVADLVEDDSDEEPHSVPEGFASQVTKTVRTRGGDYGSPAQNHQLTADLWSSWLSRRLRLSIQLSAEDVCMLNVLQKQSRLAFVTKDDSWLDVAGYTENVAMLRPDQRNQR